MRNNNEIGGRPDIGLALGKIESEKTDLRLQGFTDLRRIIYENKDSQSFDQVDDRSYHAILEIVFRHVKIDVPAVSRASRYAVGKVVARLSAGASLVRALIEVGCRRLRYKTVKATLEHITQSLGRSDFGYCQPLLFDYFKALETVLNHEPHTEHLTSEDWIRHVDFFVTVVRDLCESARHQSRRHEDRLQQSSAALSNGSNMSNSTSLLHTEPRTSMNDFGVEADFSTLHNCSEDILLAFEHLLSTPCAPIDSKAEVVLEIMIKLLDVYPYVAKLQSSVYQIVDVVLAHIYNDNHPLFLKAAKALLPLIRKAWSRANVDLRESLLSILLRCKIFLPYLLENSRESDLASDLDTLMEVVRNQYIARKPRDTLQVEDIDLSLESLRLSAKPPLSMRCGALRSIAWDHEEPWVTIYIVASIYIAVDRAHGKSLTSHDMFPNTKRQRLTRPIFGLFELMKSQTHSEKIFALQVLIFVLDDFEFDETSVRVLLEDLVACLNDADQSVVRWSMLAMASLAVQKHASSPILADFWLLVAKVCDRSLRSSLLCRLACHLLSIILEQSLTVSAEIWRIAEHFVYSPDLDGPAECDETSTRLVTSMVQVCRREQLVNELGMSRAIIRWLCRSWRPGGRQISLQTSSRVQHSSIFNLLFLICNVLRLPSPQYVTGHRRPHGRLSQTHTTCLQSNLLNQYLLSKSICVFDEGHQAQSTRIIESTVDISVPPIYELVSQMLDHVVQECDALVELSLGEDALAFSNEMQRTLGNAIQLIVVGQSLAIAASGCGIVGTSIVIQAIKRVSRRMQEAVISREAFLEFADVLIFNIGSLLGNVLNESEINNHLQNGLVASILEFDYSFWKRISGCTALTARSKLAREPLDIDMGITLSQRSDVTHGLNTTTYHKASALSTGILALRASLIAKCMLLSNNVLTNSDRQCQSGLDAKIVVEHLTAVSKEEFLLLSDLLYEVTDTSIILSEDDADTILQYLQQAIVRPYNLERSEAAVGLCIDVFNRLARFWTVQDNNLIAPVGAEMYDWFVSQVLECQHWSNHVVLKSTKLLQTILTQRPDYARMLSLPSARTSLLRILRDGNLLVKDSIGCTIPAMFGLFVLREHDHILEDIMDHLPSDPTWLAGIAMRLRIVANLAASWPTLLRRCVYAIFETAGHICLSSDHAETCLKSIVFTLRLKNNSDLFAMFASQLIYTWIESQPLEAIPYKPFGFATNQALLHSVREEVVGQLLMRGSTSKARTLATYLGIDFETLVICGFHKIAAYCIARDVAVPPSDNSPASQSEANLRKIFGKEHYATLISVNFASIIACLFTLMSQEDQIQRALQKQDSFMNAANVYERIVALGHSNQPLPPNQQPSFKAKFLIAEIEHVCHRSAYEAQSIWTPTLYVYVFREILGTIQPALGSLHACAAIRKIRVLICLAGRIATEGYPLEMGLHALRPFVADASCSEDTIGIFQYLLEQGRSYLQNVPRLLLGHAMVVMVSVNGFLLSEQDSTTQESQFRAIMTRATAFKSWLSTYLAQYELGGLSEEQSSTFKTIVSAASTELLNGKHLKDVDFMEKLLLVVLEDVLQGSDLLKHDTAELLIRYVSDSGWSPCAEVSGHFDERATYYAPAIWVTCTWPDMSDDYLLWAGRILGRAYASQPRIDPDILQEWTHDKHEHRSTRSSVRSMTSQEKLLQQLCDLLRSTKRHEVGLAEAALRDAITSLADATNKRFDSLKLEDCLRKALCWRDYPLPKRPETPAKQTLQQFLEKEEVPDDEAQFSQWLKKFCEILVGIGKSDILMKSLPDIISMVEGFAGNAFRCILHLVLVQQYDSPENTRSVISQLFRTEFERCNLRQAGTPAAKLFLEAILHLMSQSYPRETVKADRIHWLQLDYNLVSEAASICLLPKTALMLLELGKSEGVKITNTARRRSRIRHEEIILPNALLLRIYEQLNEKDAFHGLERQSDLAPVNLLLDHEQNRFKTLSFQGAAYDSELRFAANSNDDSIRGGVIRALSDLNLDGLSQTFLNSATSSDGLYVDAILKNAMRLEKWDISAPAQHHSSNSMLFKVFKGINTGSTSHIISQTLDAGTLALVRHLTEEPYDKSRFHPVSSALAVVSELRDLLCAVGLDQIEEVIKRFDARNTILRSESYQHSKEILVGREIAVSSICKHDALRKIQHVSLRDARKIECHVLLASASMSRSYGALQHALTTTTYLNRLIEPCKDLGVDVTAAVQLENAKVLWSQGEMTTAVKTLRDLHSWLDSNTDHKPAMPVGKAEVLALLGSQTAEARLQKPDEIIQDILKLAVEELHGRHSGVEAGEVFHVFAAFCDQQLQNADSLEDFNRIRKLRKQKSIEIRDLDRMIKDSGSQSRDKENLKSYRNRAKLWYDLDDKECQRLEMSRLTLVRSSLENYLMALHASDDHDDDALRFSALWLENCKAVSANDVVAEHISSVPSRKLAGLINQWTSRLQDESDDEFQRLLSIIIYRICVEHPYHGIYQIFASSKTKGGKDDMALSRHSAANKIAEQLKNNPHASRTWINIHNTNVTFVRFAGEKYEGSANKPGAKLSLKNTSIGQRVEQDVLKMKVPPPTMTIELRADCDYSDVTYIARFQPEFSIATGISAPKIITALGSDGRRYKQLFKGGNDDLRQDAIMEQVFGAVSALMKRQRPTRQRNLKIRTYKVLPLTATAGVIEFVRDTVPLHDFLLPAHTRHYPNDLKPSMCRKHIQDAQKSEPDNRVKVFRKVCDQFHPVLRYFFTEHYQSPDEWYERRLAYTRSTAAISILGYILGLGDRHGHNILLDEKTGEVVHIDLGIAFEQGRILPVPEVVPFRLTRDLVDGMGITGTEGIFRRCCEFTLEALRKESYSIMTILDVLRFDPLYSWSLSPLRLKKLQEAQIENPALKTEGTELGRKVEEEGEADRALLVVNKKLSRTLSVQATVNELITAATDEKNLALLFCGWAAYA